MILPPTRATLFPYTTLFRSLKETISNLGNSLEPQSDLEKNGLKIKLANAGFRSEAASAIYQGLRIACLLGFLVPAVLIFGLDRKSTRLNSSHVSISYAVFCL